jgi:hypothetical protein
MPVEMKHPSFGTRTVEDRQVAAYERTGWTAGAEVVPETVDRTRDQVLADVGDDPEKAREALAAEQSRHNPRKGLVAALVRVVESAQPTAQPASSDTAQEA